MKLLRFLLKIIVLPIALCFWAVKWIGIFLASMASWICHLIALLIFLIALASLIFSAATWAEALPMFALSFFVFAVTSASEWFVALIGRVSGILGAFLRS